MWIDRGRRDAEETSQRTCIESYPDAVRHRSRQGTTARGARSAEAVVQERPAKSRVTTLSPNEEAAVLWPKSRQFASEARSPANAATACATRIINEVKGINRVVYDYTSKPPGTIEWA